MNRGEKMAQNPQNLEVCKKACDLSVKVYNKVKNIKGHFRMKEQVTSSALSIASNLAEACGCDHPKETAHKLVTCIGEANETETRLNFFKDVELLSEEDHKELINQLRPLRMGIFNLKKKILSSTR